MLKKSLFTLLFLSVIFGLKAQFIKTHNNGMDHNHYSIESIGEDIIMAGTVYPAGSLTNTDIHVQRLDVSGNVIWEIYHDIGDDERCLDISLQGEKYILLTGSTVESGQQRIFVMRLNQVDGSLFDMVVLMPDIYSNHLDQFGLDIVYAPSVEQYYISGWADKDISTYPHYVSPGGGLFTPDDVGLLICLDNNLYGLWSKESRTTGITSTTNIVDIPGVGIVQLGSNLKGGALQSNGDITLFDYNGSSIWSISPEIFLEDLQQWTGVASVKGLAYDAANDRILANISLGGDIIYLVEIKDASLNTAYISNIMEYKLDPKSKSTISMAAPLDITLNPSQNKIYITCDVYNTGVSSPLNSKHPAVLTIDFNTLLFSEFRYTKNSAPAHWSHDHDYYSWISTGRLGLTGRDISCLWEDGLAVLSYDYSGSTGNNTYNLTINKTNAVGNTIEECNEKVVFESNEKQFRTKTPPVFFELTHDILFHSSSTYAEAPAIIEGCHEELPCDITITGVSPQNVNCYVYEQTLSVTAGSGTYINKYYWNWGDGSSSITTTPIATHDYGNSPANCTYTICVTVEALGADGNICYDTYCYTQLMVNSIVHGCDECGMAPIIMPQNNKSSKNSYLNTTETQLLPNPTNEYVKLQGFTENIQVTITDISGKVVLSTTIRPNQKLNVSKLNTGIYLIQADDNLGNSLREKLIVN